MAKMKDSTCLKWGILGIIGFTIIHIIAIYTNGINLFFDEAQYWNWAKNLDFGYYSKPPMLAWAIFGTTSIFGDGEWCVRLSSPIFHMFTALILMLLGKKMFGAKIGMWVGLSYITLPAVSFSALLISTDVFLLFFWAAGLFFLYDALKKDTWASWISVGLCFGFGMLSKYVMLFFPLSLALFYLWNGGAKKALGNAKIWVAFALGFLVYAPNLYWNYVHKFASYLHTKDNTGLDGDLFHPLKCLEFIGSQFGVAGPILFAVLVIMVWNIRKVKDFNFRFLLAFFVPLLAVISLQALLTRANANWAAAAYASGVVAAVAWLWQKGHKRWLYASVILHIVVAVILYTEALTVFGDSRLDIMRRAKGWDKAGEQVSLMLAQNSGALLLADERKILTPFLYYVRPFPAKIYKWNPGGQVKDHYDLTTNMNEAKGRDFILVTKRSEASEFLPYFASANHLKRIVIPVYDDYKIRLNVFRLNNFKGYGNGANENL